MGLTIPTLREEIVPSTTVFAFGMLPNEITTMYSKRKICLILVNNSLLTSTLKESCEKRHQLGCAES